MNIQDILKGTKPGRLQSVGYMQIIPLISGLIDNSFTMPSKAEVSTQSYGSLIVKNLDNSLPMILPFGAGYVVSQSAQDHATPKARLIGADKTATIDVAACIQESQGGGIQRGQHKMTILPWSIKEAAIMKKDEKSYSKLWPSIKEFNVSLGLMNRGHLEYFMDKFKDTLDEFIGQFEITHNQVGAIILMNGYVVGIERAPNYNFWKELWNPLIRECYGSLAIQYAKKFGDDPAPPRTRIPLKSTGITSLDDIRNALTSAEKKEEETAKGIVRTFIKNDFDTHAEEENDGVSVESVDHKQFTGQIVRNNEEVVYASLVTTGKWAKSQKWHEADGFTI